MKIEEKIKEYLLKEIIHGKSDIRIDEQLIDTGLVDSIQIIKIILYLEDEFLVAFVEDDLVTENFETVEEIGKMLRRKGVEG